MKEKPIKTRQEGVYRWKDGRWWIKATVTEPATGRRRVGERTLGAHLSFEEAVEARWRLRSRLVEAVTKDPADWRARAVHSPKETTLANYALEWVETRAPEWKPSYQEHVADVLGRRVLPVLGGILSVKLCREDMLAWVRHVEALESPRGQAYAADTLSSWWRILGTFARDLSADFGIPDPTRRVKGPRSAVSGIREARTLTLEQLVALLDAVQEHYPTWHSEAFTTAWTGMRVGEIRALHWEDVSFDEHVIRVHRAVSNGKVSTTKTGKGRDVALTPALREVLLIHRNQMVREQHPGLTSGLVFPGVHGDIRGQNALGKVLRISATAAQISVRVGPQVLRRTFNTLLRLHGVQPEVVRAQMGHTSQAMTNRYFQTDSTAIASAVESLQIQAGAGGGEGR
jgi:integrase